MTDQKISYQLVAAAMGTGVDSSSRTSRAVGAGTSLSPLMDASNFAHVPVRGKSPGIKLGRRPSMGVVVGTPMVVDAMSVVAPTRSTTAFTELNGRLNGNWECSPYGYNP